MPTGQFGDSFRDIWADPTKRRAGLFAWIASWAQALEFSTFPFYLPIPFVLLGGVSSIPGTNFLTLGLHCVAIVSGLVGPQIVHRTCASSFSASRSLTMRCPAPVCLSQGMCHRRG